jgi:hypothetical protein
MTEGNIGLLSVHGNEHTRVILAVATSCLNQGNNTSVLFRREYSTRTSDTGALKSQVDQERVTILVRSITSREDIKDQERLCFLRKDRSNSIMSIMN